MPDADKFYRWAEKEAPNILWELHNPGAGMVREFIYNKLGGRDGQEWKTSTSLRY